MAPTGTRLKSKKQQAMDAELSVIIDEMGQAMWNANKGYIATSQTALTENMRKVLYCFQDYCMRYYGKKS